MEKILRLEGLEVRTQEQIGLGIKRFGLSLLLGLLMLSLAMPAWARPKIVWTSWGDTGVRASHQAITDSFNKAYPDVEVVYQHTATDYFTKLQTMIAGGVAPDVFLLDMSTFANMVRKGTLLDLQPFFDASHMLREEWFFRPVLEGARFRGRIFAVPREGGPPLIYFNKSLFDEAGVAYPQESWTWHELVNIAKKLTKFDSRGRVISYGFHTDQWASWVWSNGGDILNVECTKSEFSNPKTVEAFQWLADLKLAHKVAPPLEALGEQNPVEMFMTGRLAMRTGPRADWFVLKDARFPWGIQLMPYGKAGRRTEIFANVVSISSTTKYPKEAVQFVSWLLGPEGWRIRLAGNKQAGVPLNITVTKTDDFLSNGNPWVTKEINEKIVASVPHCRLLPVIPQWPEIAQKLTTAFEYLWAGKKTASQICNELDKEINLLLR